MKRIVKGCRGGMIPCMLILCFAAMAAGGVEAKGSLGIYIYENIEGYHTVSSTAGTELTNTFLPLFEKVMAYDRVPLQSNETARILEEMTKDRKVAVTAISTWLSGGVISAPTITFADDDIKFRDLTWHIDQEAVIADARKNGMTHALFGTISGFVRSVEGADTKGRLVSVNATANLKLVDISQGTVVWAETYRDTKAGFDARTAFEDAAFDLSSKAGSDVLAFLEE
jgi:hypothetical protein